MKKTTQSNKADLTIEELIREIKGLQKTINKIGANNINKKAPKLLQQTEYLVSCFLIKCVTKEIIENCGKKQNELALELGISKQSITEYKKGNAIPSTPIFFLLWSKYRYLVPNEKIEEFKSLLV